MIILIFLFCFFVSSCENISDGQVPLNTKLIEQFDADFIVRYINLDRSLGKNKLMQKQFAREHIDAIRFSAIDGGLSNFDFDYLLQQGKFSSLYKNPPERPPLMYRVAVYAEKEIERIVTSRARLSNGTAATALSHEQVWREALESNKNLMVFEDDVVLAENFVSQVLAGYEKLPSDWDIYYLSSIDCERIPVNDVLFTVDKSCLPYGHAYVINHSSLPKMLQFLSVVHMHWDVQISTHFGKDIKAYWLNGVSLAEQGLNSSDRIEADMRARAKKLIPCFGKDPRNCF